MACEPELRSISARLTAPSAATSTRITTVLAVLRAAGRWPARSASSIFVMKAESQSRTAGETLSREAPGPASSSRPSTAPQACIRRVAINRRWRLPKQVSRRLGCRALPSRLQPPDVRQAQCPPRTPQGAPARSHSSDGRSMMGDVPVAVEILKEGGVARLEPVGSGCRIHFGEQRHEERYHIDGAG